VAESSDVIFTMVGFPKDVEEVILGDDGVMSGVSKGTVLVDMTTSSPSLAKVIYEKAKSVHASSLDAPVSGGDVGAKNATLTIMVGGDTDVFHLVRPLLDVMAMATTLMGASGCGQHAKMSNQIAVAASMIGACEAMVYAHKCGLNVEAVLGVISQGAAGSWTLTHLAPRMLKRDFEPGFYVQHFVKDLGIAVAEAERMKLSLPGLALAVDLYTTLMKQNRGLKGSQALLLALEEMNQSSQ